MKHINQIIAMEREMDFDDRIGGKPLGHHTLIKFLGLFAQLPKLSFDEEDVNRSVVKQLLKYPKELKTLEAWIIETDYDLLDDMRKAMRVLMPICRPPRYAKYYRGIGMHEGQQTHGLVEDHWFHGGRKKEHVEVGMTFQDEPKFPTSFTYHQPTADLYGKMVLSIDGNRNHNRLLHITKELDVALLELDPSDHPLGFFASYGESIYLPDGQPLEFTIESIGKKKE